MEFNIIQKDYENPLRVVKHLDCKNEKIAKKEFKEFLEEAPKYEGDRFDLVKIISTAFIEDK